MYTVNYLLDTFFKNVDVLKSKFNRLVLSYLALNFKVHDKKLWRYEGCGDLKIIVIYIY